MARKSNLSPIDNAAAKSNANWNAAAAEEPENAARFQLGRGLRQMAGTIRAKAF
ncbi:MAG: hypothetical protein WKF92_14875 [Pyrinomonadaceae bacterium]